MKIDSASLKQVEKNKDKRKTLSRDIVLSSYIKILHNLIEFHENIPSDETAMFVNSLNHWCNDRKKGRKTKKYNPGDIVEIEFGIKYKSEISYRHSGIVMKDLKRKVFVIPMTSNSTILKNAFHPASNPSGSWEYRKVDETDGFDHTCALILNDVCSISKNRIMSKCGDISISPCLLSEIKTTILNEIFTDEMSEYEKKIDDINNELNLKKVEIDSLNAKLVERKRKIDFLYSKIKKQENRKQ